MYAATHETNLKFKFNMCS